MSADQTPGRPTADEWADALGRAVKAWDCCGTCAGGILAPLIAREREAAKAEGAASVAGPVLALHAGTHWCFTEDGQNDVFEPGTEWWPCPTFAAIPEGVLADLARLKAQWQAEALREAAEGVDLSGFYDPALNGRVSTSCYLAENAARDYLHARAARIAREAQQDGGE